MATRRLVYFIISLNFFELSSLTLVALEEVCGPRSDYFRDLCRIFLWKLLGLGSYLGINSCHFPDLTQLLE